MKKRFSMLLMVLVSAMAFAACESNNMEDARTGAPAMTDTQLEEAINAKLDADMQLREADLSVEADADRNEVTLSGTVPTQEIREKAVQLAKTAHAGLIVTDKIDVVPGDVSRENYTEEMAREQRERASRSGDNVGDSLDDAWIHTKVVAKLIGNMDTPQRKINVDVNNNVVTLRGTVDTAAEKSEAERVARETDGVRQVINQIKVGKVPA